MAGLSPRKAEVEAVVEILERTVPCPDCDGDPLGDPEELPCGTCYDTGRVSAWESPEDLARALLRETFKIFQHRDTLYIVGVPNGYGQLVAYGPYATLADAERATRDSSYEGGIVRPMYGEQLLLFDDDTEKQDDVLCKCGHPKGTHQHEKGRGWCWALGGSTKKGNVCGCQEFSGVARPVIETEKGRGWPHETPDDQTATTR